jgi:hypothetical protein
MSHVRNAQGVLAEVHSRELQRVVDLLLPLNADQLRHVQALIEVHLKATKNNHGRSRVGSHSPRSPPARR